MTAQKKSNKKTKKRGSGKRAPPATSAKSHKARQAPQPAEQPLAVSQERFELALESLSVGIWDWSLPEKRLYWSPKYKQMLGITDVAFQPTPTDFEGRLHPDDRLTVVTALTAHLRNQVPFDVECRLRHDDGHYLWARLCGMAQRDETGTARRMVGSIDDISIRKEAEQKLSEREARLRNMFEHAVDGMITNFHMPHSTLLMLVCAFAGYEPVMSAYRHAVEERYRFFSYGDAMLIV